MNKQEFDQARREILGVTLARVLAAGIGIKLAWQGDHIGAVVLFSMIPLLHFALPVIPDK